MNVLQITDLHLMQDPKATLKGVPTRASFLEVRNYIIEQELHFDLIVITGDLAHDEQRETYVQLRELIADWIDHCQFIPGNHDDRKLMREIFPELVRDDTELVNFSIEREGWRFIGLDSHLPGEVSGDVDEQQLQWLQSELAAHSDQPTMLFIHHPPFSVRTKWLDKIGLIDPEPLREIIRSASQIQAVCAGHVHHSFEDVLGDVQLLTSPSTGVQFQPKTETPVYDPIPPGFRTFVIEDGKFETTVTRVPDLKYRPDQPEQPGKDWSD